MSASTWSRTLPFAVREKVTLALDSKGKRSVQIEAIVRTRNERDGFRLFGFSFSRPTALRAQLSAGLLRLFNERRSFRVRAQREGSGGGAD